MKIDWRALSTEEAAALVCTTLDAAGITATLVGGACVMIYSRGEYVSHDLDFVSDAALRDITAVLGTILPPGSIGMTINASIKLSTSHVHTAPTCPKLPGGRKSKASWRNTRSSPRFFGPGIR